MDGGSSALQAGPTAEGDVRWWGQCSFTYTGPQLPLDGPPSVLQSLHVVTLTVRWRTAGSPQSFHETRRPPRTTAAGDARREGSRRGSWS